MNDRKNTLTLASYSKFAKEYADSNMDSSFWFEHFIEFCKVVPGKRILDIGSGGGRDAGHFLKKKFSYVGVDASPGLLREARRRYPRAKFLQMNFYNLHFPEKSFDGIWSAATLLHAQRRYMPEILKQIFSLLVPGGIAYISLKARKNKSSEIVHRKKGQATMKRYFTYYSKDEFRAMATKQGFSIRKIKQRKKGTNIWLSIFLQRPNN